MNRHNYYVYITTNPRKTVLYTGLTNDLKTRMGQHYANRGQEDTFAGRYYCYNLIYFEHFEDIEQAIDREKEVKKMRRALKEKLIAEMNPSLSF